MMTETDKKLNQILNLLDLVHSENVFFLGLIKNMCANDHDKMIMEEYIEKCNLTKQGIKSGMYEDEIVITH